MTAKRFQARRPVRLLAAGGTANRVVATTDGVTLTMQQVASSMVMPTGRATTLNVAANNATALVKSLADYVCDGVADEVQINAACASLPAAGGAVVLSEGTFTLASPIYMGSGGKRTLRGMGMQATLLQVVNNGGSNVNGGMIQMEGGYSEVSDLTLDGNRANNAAQTQMIGIYVPPVANPSIQRCRVVNSAHNGITVWNVAENGVIRDCLIENSEGLSIYLYCASGQPFVVSGCTTKGGSLGYYLDGGAIELSNCEALNATYQGFGIYANASASLSQCRAQSCGAEGFYVNAAVRAHLASCRAVSCVNAGFYTDGTQAQFIGCVATDTSGNGHGFLSTTGALQTFYSGCVSGPGNVGDGFRHANVDASTYIGCRVVSAAASGFQATNGNIHVYDCTVIGAGSSSVHGVALNGGSRHVIEGSRIESMGQHGIVVSSGVLESQIINNSIYNISLLTNNGYWGIIADANTTFVYGNTVRDGTGNRPYGGIATGGNSTGTYFGHNDVYGAGVSAEILDTGVTSRQPVKTQLAYTFSADLFNATAVTANVWYNAGPSHTFRVDSSRDIIDLSAQIYILVGGNNASPAWMIARMVLDGSIVYPYGAGIQENANVWQNPFAGGASVKLTGLSVGNHTVVWQFQPAINELAYLRAAYEHYYAQVLEYAR